MNKAKVMGYDDDRGSINLCCDSQALTRVQALIKEKKKLHPRYVILVGIGGSSLGAKAIQEAVLGKIYNQSRGRPKILYAETVDPDTLGHICKLAESVLEKNENILINVVSKSGTTTETIANAMVLIDLLKKYRDNYNECVVITTEKDSKLWAVAKEMDMDTLEIPKKVGGRYSVFSPTGLFPLGFLGINISLLLQGAAFMKKKCLTAVLEKNPALLSATIYYLHYLKNKNINNTFFFAVDLESLGKWYRQLMAESLGKECLTRDEEIEVGMTPTVSIGSTDLHSMAQLYLGGPRDKVTTFVSLKHYMTSTKIPSLPGFKHLVENMNGRPLQDIMDALLKGVKNAYIKRKRPFLEIILPDKSEGSIGQFIQLKMMEIMYLGALMNVNPFNQPHVENYKRETRKILAKKNKETIK